MGAELASRVWGTVGGVYIGVAIKWLWLALRGVGGRWGGATWNRG
jgi:drug/metabolite transporter superfamily protein YnfA